MDAKGISPLLASIILIAITASVGLALWRVISGRVGGMTGPDIQVLDASISVTPSTTIVTVTVKNTGDVRLENCTVMVYGEDQLALSIPLGNLEVGQTASQDSVNPPVTFYAGKEYAAVFRATSVKGMLSRSFTILSG